ncbi:MAG: type 1 glutamine amidotransferase domain-containing protein [Gemmatimonas sp.]|nr:type 1 glutamine amidotransferase domain-containing protein [Gemmatimonadaceae bacterium]
MAANSRSLTGKRVAILATDGVEQVELTEPRKALDAAGAKTRVVSPKPGSIRGWNHTEWGEQIPVDVSLDSASPDDFDALLLPGGVMNPDHLRTNRSAVNFVRAFFEAGKPVAAICHGPWMLVEADVARGRNVTSWPSLQTDLRNAGANWTDSQVVTDHGLVTSRKPDDIPAFNKKMIEEFAEGVHDEQRSSVHASAAH